jgi:membrane-associated protein
VDLLRWLVDISLHLDKTLNHCAKTMGGGLYAVLFVIIFCETGLVVTPFLPGDSLLFAVGALGSTEASAINLPLAGVLMSLAAVIGDAVNYSIGYRIGPKVFYSQTSRLLNKKHLLEAQRFYEKYGGKTITLARFLPIIRTFAPFVAGVGKMSYLHFAFYNVTGAVAWVALLLLAGYYFGQVPFVKQHFELVIVAIIVISLLPTVVGAVRSKKQT